MDHVERLYGFMEGLRRRAWRPGEDEEADAELRPVLAELSRRPDLRDAMLVKALAPDTDPARFRLIATRLDGGADSRRRTGDALAVVTDLLNKAWNNPAYDVKSIVQSSYHQDLPKLFSRMAAWIQPPSDQAGLRAVAAYVSWMEGDDLSVFKRYLDALMDVREMDPWADKLSGAFANDTYPAWLESETEERERAGAVMIATGAALDGMADAPSPVAGGSAGLRR